jgi:putative PIG3 family NAD(P)H quinone oxidoreductase
MKAIVVKQRAGTPVLTWQEVAEPEYGPDEVLVEVQATAVNRADLSQALGNYPPPPGVTEILGLEMAGTIREVGENVPVWQEGDRVCALLPGGGYAERATVHHQMLLPLPENWSFAQGAAVPEVWYTAFVNLFLEGSLQPGETVLLHAGASGVGTAAIQLATEVGATAIVTAGSSEKVAACRELGAAVAINYRQQDFLSETLAATAGEGVDLILDPVGGSYLARNLQALRPFGRLVNIGLLGGRDGEMDMGLLLRKRLCLIGSTLRSRPLKEKIEITRQFRERFWPLLVDGRLQPIIDTTFPLPEAQAAHEYVAQNRNVGKVVLLAPQS